MRSGEELLSDPVAWGRLLVQTDDHDPLYSGLARWDVSSARKMRYMLAYWQIYNVGAAWFISKFEGQHFWSWVQTAALNETGPVRLGVCEHERWPRAHERRHWRGQKCVDSVLWMRRRFPDPEAAVASLSACGTLREVEAAVTQWPQFGPWIAFKAADMLERILGWPIAFPPDIITFYRDPKKAADMLGELWGQEPQAASERLLAGLSDILVPGASPRHLGYQELETVLCKWKAAHGYYRIGLDTRDHRAELEQWGAQDLLAAYPTLPA